MMQFRTVHSFLMLIGYIFKLECLVTNVTLEWPVPSRVVEGFDMSVQFVPTRKKYSFFFGNAQDKCKNQLPGYIQLLTCGASIFSGFMPSCIVGIQLCFSCKIYIAFNALDFFVRNRCLESFNGRSFFGMPVSLQMHIIMTSEIII